MIVRSLEDLKAMGRHVERPGAFEINMYRATSPVAPFGGTGDSGTGRESGEDAIDDYTRVKTVWINSSGEPTADPFVVG